MKRISPRIKQGLIPSAALLLCAALMYCGSTAFATAGVPPDLVQPTMPAMTTFRPPLQGEIQSSDHTDDVAVPAEMGTNQSSAQTPEFKERPEAGEPFAQDSSRNDFQRVILIIMAIADLAAIAAAAVICYVRKNSKGNSHRERAGSDETGAGRDGIRDGDIAADHSSDVR